MTIDEIEVRKSEIENEIVGLDYDNVEHRGRLDELNAEFESLKLEESRIIAEAEEAEQRRAEVANNPANITLESETHEVGKMNIEVRNSKEYIDAYAEYIKTGELRANEILSENVDSGVVPVPDILVDIVKTAWESDDIARRVKRTYLKGNVRVGFELSATDAVIHTEGAAAPTAEALTFGVVTLTPSSIKKWLTISDEVYDMRGEQFLTYLYRELTHKIAKKAVDELVSKITSCGTAAGTSSVGVPAFTAASISATTIATAIGNLTDEASKPVVMMNKASYAAFKAVQYGNGYGIDVFEGCDVCFNDSIKSFDAATTGEVYCVVGDLESGAQFNFPNGSDITLKFDDLSLAEKDLIKIVGRQYVGIGLVADKRFCNIKK